MASSDAKLKLSRPMHVVSVVKTTGRPVWATALMIASPLSAPFALFWR